MSYYYPIPSEPLGAVTWCSLPSNAQFWVRHVGRMVDLKDVGSWDSKQMVGKGGGGAIYS